MSLTAIGSPPCPSCSDLLPRVLHELAQPLSALECSLELALRDEPDLSRCRHALETAREIAERLSERLTYFRDLSEAVHPCDCLRPLNAADAVCGAAREVGELAASLGVRIEINVDSHTSYGNREKLQFALVRLFDFVFQSGGPARVHLVCADKRMGEIRLRGNPAKNELASPRPLELARAALATMGADLPTEMRGGEFNATILLCPYHCPEAITSV
jgi:signal transduction histidine kinase